MRFISFLIFCGFQLFANVNGVDTQLFKPVPDGLDFLTVHSSRVLPPLTFNTGLFFNGSFNSLLVAEDKKTYTADDVLLSSDLSLAMGVFKNFEIFMSTPASLYHHTNPDLPGLEFVENGFLEIAGGMKYSLVPRKGSRKWGVALIPSMNYPVVQDYYFVGRDKNPIFNMELALDYGYKQFTAAMNIGYRYRSPGEDVFGEDLQLIDDQVIASFGLTYFDEGLSTGVTAELYAASQVNEFFDSEKTPFEALIAAKYSPTYDVSLIFGGAVGLSVSIGNPDYRIFAGLNYSFNFSQKDKKVLSQFEEDLLKVGNFKKNDSKFQFSLPDSLIYFGWDNYKVTKRSKDFLSRVASEISGNNNIQKVHIIGHTDSTGSAAYNQGLSERRARAVKEYLIKNGIARAKITSSGKGENEPIDSNFSYIGRARNRRVEIVIQ